MKREEKNYQIISKALEDKNHLQLPSIDSFVCPMVYPFMTNDKSLREQLIRNKVFVARYWPNVLEWCKEEDIEYKLAAQIIPLPIDQRYSKSDMERILEIIK